jgi:hypothetical protein
LNLLIQKEVHNFEISIPFLQLILSHIHIHIHIYIYVVLLNTLKVKSKESKKKVQLIKILKFFD